MKITPKFDDLELFSDRLKVDLPYFFTTGNGPIYSYVATIKHWVNIKWIRNVRFRQPPLFLMPHTFKSQSMFDIIDTRNAIGGKKIV